MDIVLGVQWLNTLGRILFNFKHRTIEFLYKGKKHVLRGATSLIKTSKAKAWEKVEGSESQFFMMTLAPDVAETIQCFNIQASQGNDLPLVLKCPCWIIIPAYLKCPQHYHLTEVFLTTKFH